VKQALVAALHAPSFNRFNKVLGLFVGSSTQLLIIILCVVATLLDKLVLELQGSCGNHD
jgi:hypothetical protein